MASDLHKLRLRAADIEFEGLSFSDYTGRLFRWNHELYRAIPPERASFCRELFNNGVMHELIEKGLFVQTEIAPLELDGYPIVLRHQQIPFVSYPHEWADSMLKDAALYHLDLCLELDRHRLESTDAGPWNILFDRGRPVFVDFGSIQSLPEGESPTEWQQSEPFRRFFVNPLLLMAQGHHRIARWLLRDYERGVEERDVRLLTHSARHQSCSAQRPYAWIESVARRIVPPPLRFEARKLFGRASTQHLDTSVRTRGEFLQRLREEVERIALPQIDTHVREEGSPSYSASDQGRAELHRVSELLHALKPASVLDVCSDDRSETYARLIVRSGIPAVVLGSDEYFLRQLYAYASSEAVPLLPLRLAIFSPADDLSNTWFAPASRRLQCDLVLALGTIESLVTREPVHSDRIVDRLSQFAARALVLDSVSPEKLVAQHPPSSRATTRSWYSFDSLAHLLRKHFRNVTTLSLDPSHVLFVCTKQ